MNFKDANIECKETNMIDIGGNLMFLLFGVAVMAALVIIFYIDARLNH